jgi:hypothetical protein
MEGRQNLIRDNFSSFGDFILRVVVAISIAMSIFDVMPMYTSSCKIGSPTGCIINHKHSNINKEC